MYKVSGICHLAVHCVVLILSSMWESVEFCSLNRQNLFKTNTQETVRDGYDKGIISVILTTNILLLFWVCYCCCVS